MGRPWTTGWRCPGGGTPKERGVQEQGARVRVSFAHPLPSANLATVVVENKPVGRPQEGVAVPPLAQGLHGERLAQDHVVSHNV